MGVTRPSLSADKSSGPTIDNLSGTAEHPRDPAPRPVLGQNRLEGTGKDLLEDEEVINLYVGRLS
jgi:hypothetical protein